MTAIRGRQGIKFSPRPAIAHNALPVLGLCPHLSVHDDPPFVRDWWPVLLGGTIQRWGRIEVAPAAAYLAVLLTIRGTGDRRRSRCSGSALRTRPSLVDACGPHRLNADALHHPVHQVGLPQHPLHHRPAVAEIGHGDASWLLGHAEGPASLGIDLDQHGACGELAARARAAGARTRCRTADQDARRRASRGPKTAAKPAKAKIQAAAERCSIGSRAMLIRQ
jgi:hypothetical protein